MTLKKVKIIGSIIVVVVILGISLWVGLQVLKYAATALVATLVGAALMYFFLRSKKLLKTKDT